MFGSMVVGLEAGESDSLSGWCDVDVDQLAVELTEEPSAQADCEVELPEGFEDLVPGPVLGLVVSLLDRNGLSAYDQVRVLQADQRLVSHYSSRVYGDMAAVHESTVSEFSELDAGEVWDAASLEVAAALSWTRRAADVHLELALGLVVHPRVLGMLSSGVVDVPRARVILGAVESLDAFEADTMIDRIAGAAGGLTTGQLRVRLQRLVLEVDPDSARSRYVRSVGDRRVEVLMSSTGSVHLSGLDLPVVEAAQVWELLSYTALRLRQQGDQRTLDQLRADVYLDLLTGRTHPTTSSGLRRGVVNLDISVHTLNGGDTPGEIPGVGPVHADIARDLAANPDVQWCYRLNHHDHIHSGVLRRNPNATLRREVQTRYPTCVAPGCRVPSSKM